LKPLANASVVKKKLIDFGELGYARKLIWALAHLRTCKSIILMNPNIHNVDF